VKKILLLTAFLLLSFSFKNAEPDLRWVATMEIFIDQEGSIVIYYKGDIPQCMSKKIVDFIYEDCDTVKYSIEDVERSLKVKFDVISDTCKKDVKKNTCKNNRNVKWT